MNNSTLASCRNCGGFGYRRESNGEPIPCDLCDDNIEAIRAEVGKAITDHAKGGDLWLCSHLAAKNIGGLFAPLHSTDDQTHE
jgi:hypothetical protein